MDIVMVPGFWLDASSWDEVVPTLEAAGHSVYPLTLPGLESVDAPRAGIGLRDHIDAVVRVVDGLVGAGAANGASGTGAAKGAGAANADGKLVLVGHSGGGAIIHGVVDARPNSIARAVYVDSGPLGVGAAINDELPAERDEVPLPPWDGFEKEDLVDLTEELKAAFRARAIPQPRGVAQDKQELHDVRRYDVPATVITSEFPSEMLRDLMDKGHPYTEELARIHDIEIVDLPTGHWPQFTRPAELAQAILRAVDRS